MAKELGIPSGSVTAWKQGATPRSATLHKLAQYFDVTVDYLLGKEESISDEALKFALFGGDGPITDEMLGGSKRPEEGSWYDQPRTKYVAAEYMLAMRWGPSMAYLENGALYRDEAVEVLAEENGWSLIRAQNGFYRWVVSGLLTENVPAAAATPTPEPTVAPEAPATADNPI